MNKQNTVYGIKLPSFVIAGAAKSGTTSLSRYIDDHPEIYIPDQEMNYFAFAKKTPDYSVAHNKLLDSFERYQSFYRFPENREPQITGEKSVSYLYYPWHEHVIQNIKRIHPSGEKLKIIIILRHPVERMYSQYLFNTRHKEKLPFEKAIRAWKQREAKSWVPAYDYIGAGFYYDAVKAYMEHFNNVKVYLFEDLKNNPKKLLHNLFGFIGANTDFIPDRLGETYNESGSPKNNFIGSLYQQRWLKGLFKTVKDKLPENMTKKMTQSLKSRATEKPTLSRELKSELTKIYAEDIKKLENLIERDLSHWRK